MCASYGIQFRFTAVCLFWVEDAGGLTRQRAFIIGAHSSRGVLELLRLFSTWLVSDFYRTSSSMRLFNSVEQKKKPKTKKKIKISARHSRHLSQRVFFFKRYRNCFVDNQSKSDEFEEKGWAVSYLVLIKQSDCYRVKN